MSEINVQKSNYFKIKDLEDATGKPWGQSNLIVTVESASIGEYPSQDGKPPEEGFFLQFAGFEKPLGCNLTIRKTIEGIVGDVEWDTAALGGLHLQLYAEHTQMGPGVRVRFHQPGSEEPAPPPGGDPVMDEEPAPF
jgi:hypothetical protein